MSAAERESLYNLHCHWIRFEAVSNEFVLAARGPLRWRVAAKRSVGSRSIAENPIMTASLQIRTIVSQPFDENTYVVWRAGRKDALVIDPGLEPDLILDFL